MLDPKIVSVGTTCQVGLIGLIYLAFNSHFIGIVQQAEPEALHSILYVVLLGAFSTGFANLLFMKLIRDSSPVFASSTTYLIPVFAILWGIYDNEVLAYTHYFGMAAILGGVLLVNKAQ